MPDHSEISKLDLFLAGHLFLIEERFYRLNLRDSGNVLYLEQQQLIDNSIYVYFGMIDSVDEKGFMWSRSFFGKTVSLPILFSELEFISQQAETPVNA